MSQEITPDDFQKFASLYPELAPIGMDNLGPKIWIMFNALRDNSVSLASISHKPCASLMENSVSYDDIKNILSDLRGNGLLWYQEPEGPYHLKNNIAYVLQRLSFDLTRKLPSSEGEMSKILQECGYSNEFRTFDSMKPLFSDDNNTKTSKLKELLAEVAFSGLRLIIKLMNKAEDSVE